MAEEERPHIGEDTSQSAPDPPPPAQEDRDGVEPDVGAQHALPLPREIEDRLAQAEARSEALAAELEAERTILRQAQDERDALREQVSRAAAKYREVLLAALPEVPLELVAGQSVEEIDRSLVSARATVDVVRRQLAGRAAAERVPAGAPARGAPDLSALSPREKIALALSRG